MGYVFLGSAAVLDARHSERVAVPGGVSSLEFHAADGRPLPGPVDGTCANLALGRLDDEWLEHLVRAEFEGCEVIRPAVDGMADPLVLCTGVDGSCPTTREELDAVGGHTCDGVLAHYAGALHWVVHDGGTWSQGAAGSRYEVHRNLASDPVAMARLVASESGAEALWDPDPAAEQEIALANRTVVRLAVKAGQTPLSYMIGGSGVLLAPREEDFFRYHNWQYVMNVRARWDDWASGRILTARTGRTGHGTFRPQGVPQDKEHLVRAALLSYDHLFEIDFG
ncbi:hypothetical protein [Streptomyces sp. WAC06614]|uniref:hypothetical protein n=1 Tax=Streptomyces sp. WAC06614 TaxID=2487416 RepID=UPI000F769236|nr:hypothetical protein [Streptomyces sp. WAC06614]RSS79748.1 hypothetical protein EF918_16130 [Streptomyces sp. WAC06614]